MRWIPVTRRRFLERLGLLGGLVALDSRVSSAQAPPSERRVPPAISGDRLQPSWEEKLTITVGPSQADIAGFNEKAVQAAVDYVKRYGGGTVHLKAGTFGCRNAVVLQPGVRIVGDGPETILRKEPSVTSPISANSDWYDQEITLANPNGFRVGDGVCLRAKNPDHGGPTVLKRTLVARSGNRFKLDRALDENLWREGSPTAATLFPLLTSEHTSNLVVENLCLDGNRANNENLDGNYAGCIFLQNCRDVLIRGVHARNYNGDGISWQICHDVRVLDCRSEGHAGLGLHPGSGSQRPLMRGNSIERCDIGIFFCWGVRFGLAEKNQIRECGASVSIGHRDTDNLVRENDILDSKRVAVLFRDEKRVFAGHRNVIQGNRVTNIQPDAGAAIDIQGETDDVTIERNTIKQVGNPGKRVGIRVGAKTKGVVLCENQIEGFATEVEQPS